MSGSIVRATGGGGIKAAGSRAFAGGREAEAGRTIGGADVGLGRDVERTVEDIGHDGQPHRRVAAASDRESAIHLGAGILQHAQTVAEREAHAFEHGLGQVVAGARLVESDEAAARTRIVVRRPLAGQSRA